MLGPLSKLAITVLLALAWLRAGSPIEPERLRSRLKWTLGLAVGLRTAFELVMRAPAGAATTVMEFVAAVAALALFWLLLRLAYDGPFTRADRTTRLVFSLIGLIVLWVSGPGDTMLWLWIATTRCRWPPALSTPERLRASVASLAAGLVLLIGVHQVPGISHAASVAEGIAWFGRGIAIVHALVATSAAFKAFTSDPTLGIRRVSHRLAISHVLVVSVPLATVVTLWISSTYLGVNADRALTTVRAMDREGIRIEESLRAALASGCRRTRCSRAGSRISTGCPGMAWSSWDSIATWAPPRHVATPRSWRSSPSPKHSTARSRRSSAPTCACRRPARRPAPPTRSSPSPGAWRTRSATRGTPAAAIR